MNWSGNMKIKNAIFYNRDTEFPYMSKKAITSLEKYLGSHTFPIVEIDGQKYMFDVEQLSKRIDFHMCEKCSTVYGNKFCCCDGPSYSFDTITYEKVKEYETEIRQTIERYDTNFANIIDNKPLFDDEWQSMAEIKTDKGSRCSCLVVLPNGVGRCAIKLLAIDKCIDFFDICNMSCLLEPLEVIDIISSDDSKIRFITSIVGIHEQDFIRFDWLELNLCCCNSKYGKPVYKEMKQFIVHEFGLKVYNKIWSLCR